MIPELWREMLSKGKSVVIVGVHNPITAKIGLLAGFDGIWWSSFEMSTSFALPDAGLLWPDEISSMVLKSKTFTPLPQVIDLGAGFGGTLQLSLAVERLIISGASVFSVEDQEYPKINSIISANSVRLCDISHMTERIRTIKRVIGEKYGLIARVESLLAGESLSKALERGKAYTDAGADAIIVHSVSNNALDLKDFSNDWNCNIPLIAIPTMFDTLDVDTLAMYGYSIVIFANALIRSALKAMLDSARQLKKSKKLSEIDSRMLSMSDVRKLLDY